MRPTSAWRVFLCAIAAGALGCGEPTGGGITDSFPIVVTHMPTSDVFAGDLYLVSSDGRQLRQLTDVEGTEWDPAWSPDGTRIAYAWQPGLEETSDIVIIDADGTDATQITGSGRSQYPSWSPDGTRLALLRRTEAFRGVAVLNLDGTGLTLLSGTGNISMRPAWSPDGEWIAFGGLVFVAPEGEEHQAAILLIRPDGSDLHQLVTVPCGANSPAWSPDGERVAFVGCSGLLVVERTGGEPLQVTTSTSDALPTWSADGALLVFQRQGATSTDLYSVRPDGTELRRLTRFPGTMWGADWQPESP